MLELSVDDEDAGLYAITRPESPTYKTKTHKGFLRVHQQAGLTLGGRVTYDGHGQAVIEDDFHEG